MAFVCSTNLSMLFSSSLAQIVGHGGFSSETTKLTSAKI